MKRSRPDNGGLINARPSETRYINLLWCSLAGLRCVRVVPVVQKKIAAAAAAAADQDQDQDHDSDDVTSWLPHPLPTASLSRACITLPCHADIPSPGAGVPSDGDVILTIMGPTVELRPLPWRPHHFMAPVTMCDPISGQEWPLCPRSCLIRLGAHFSTVHGIEFRVGFEIEFAVATEDKAFVDHRTYCSTGAFDVAAPMLEDMTEALQKLGMTVEQLHKESAPGQFEIVLGHRPLLEAVDGLLLARETIAAIARRHQRCVTFLPKYMANQAGNGCHVHISLWRDGKNMMCIQPRPSSFPKDLDAVLEEYGAETLDPTVRQFLGGVQALLPALMCFTTPTPNSFRRIQPGAWAGAFQGWGIGNKEVPLRLPVLSVEHGLFSNFELKLFDATANPYIAVASILAAGFAGMSSLSTPHAENSMNGMDLPPPIKGDPGQLTPIERRAQGIRALPKDWTSAKAALMAPNAACLRELLGEGLVQACVAVRESEWEEFERMPLGKEVGFLFNRF